MCYCAFIKKVAVSILLGGNTKLSRLRSLVSRTATRKKNMNFALDLASTLTMSRRQTILRNHFMSQDKWIQPGNWDGSRECRGTGSQEKEAAPCGPVKPKSTCKLMSTLSLHKLSIGKLHHVPCSNRRAFRVHSGCLRQHHPVGAN
jgi:hypothetical protein